MITGLKGEWYIEYVNILVDIKLNVSTASRIYKSNTNICKTIIFFYIYQMFISSLQLQGKCPISVNQVSSRFPKRGAFSPLQTHQAVQQSIGLRQKSPAVRAKLQNLCDCAGGGGDARWAGLGDTQPHTLAFSFNPTSCLPQFRGSLCILRMGGSRVSRNWVTYASRSFLKN